MNPMTKQDQIRSWCSQILDSDLNHPHAITQAIALGSKIEMTAGEIQSEAWDAEEAEIEAHPLQIVADEKFDFAAYVRDTYNPMVKAIYGKDGAA